VPLPFGREVVYREVETGPFTDTQYVMGLLLLLSYAWVVARYSRAGHRREARALFCLIAVDCLAYLNDFVVGLGLISNVYLMEYAWLTAVC